MIIKCMCRHPPLPLFLLSISMILHLNFPVGPLNAFFGPLSALSSAYATSSCLLSLLE